MKKPSKKQEAKVRRLLRRIKSAKVGVIKVRGGNIVLERNGVITVLVRK